MNHIFNFFNKNSKRNNGKTNIISRIVSYSKTLSSASMINVVAGSALIISLIIIFLKPYNKAAILTASISAGLMNAMFGVKLMKDPKKKSSGMSYVLIGIMMIFLGYYLTQYVKK